MAPPVRPKDPGRFGERNASYARQLGSSFGASYDIEYTPAAALLLVTFRTVFEFEATVGVQDQMEVKRDAQQGMGWWNESGYVLVTDHPEGCKLWGWMVGPIEFYDNAANLIETVDVWWMINHYESYCKEQGIAINPKLYL